MSAKLDRVVAIGFLVTVVFTAMAHGAVEPWSVGLFTLITAVLLVLWAIKMVVDRRVSLILPQVTVPVALLLVLGLVQAFAPAESAIASRDVEATRSAVSVLFFLLVSSIIAANFFSSRERLRILANFLIIYGLVMAVFAVVQDFAWDGRFYWWRPTQRQVFGPFVNRNHFAGYMEMLLPIPVALLITRAARHEARLLYAFAATMMGAALVVSLSRGGMISITASLIFLFLMSIRLLATSSRFSTAFRLGVVAASTMAILIAVVWIGAGPVIDRVAQTIDGGAGAEFQAGSIGRGRVWKDTWSMMESHPAAGVGLGAYETLYSTYTQTNGEVSVAQSHNDYLQVLADGGIVAGVIALGFLVLLFRAMFRAVQSRDPLLAGLALGSSAGIFGILVHSLFDFNLQLPSNALLFLLLCVVVSLISREVDKSQRQAKGVIESGTLAGVLSK
jgi:O-antigen ligase